MGWWDDGRISGWWQNRWFDSAIIQNPNVDDDHPNVDDDSVIIPTSLWWFCRWWFCHHRWWFCHHPNVTHRITHLITCIWTWTTFWFLKKLVNFRTIGTSFAGFCDHSNVTHRKLDNSHTIESVHSHTSFCDYSNVTHRIPGYTFGLHSRGKKRDQQQSLTNSHKRPI